MDTPKQNVCAEQVYNELFKTNSKTVFNYIYYKYGNEEKAYDVVQEAFIKLWENCKRGYLFMCHFQKWVSFPKVGTGNSKSGYGQFQK